MGILKDSKSVLITFNFTTAESTEMAGVIIRN